jgi:hypothetical protein
MWSSSLPAMPVTRYGRGPLTLIAPEPCHAHRRVQFRGLWARSGGADGPSDGQFILPSLLISLTFLQHLVTTPGLSSGFPVPRPQSQGASVGSRWSAILWCPIRPVSAGAQGQHRKLLTSWSRRTWRMKSKTDETALQDMLCAALHAAECPA